MSGWIKQWGYWISEKKVRTGIWRLKTGGYLAFVKVIGRDGKPQTQTKVLHDGSLEEAEAWRLDAKATLRAPKRQRRLFADYAVSLFQSKIDAGDIKSAKGHEKWETALRVHVLPFFGRLYCHEIRHADCLEFRAKVARMIGKGYTATRTLKNGTTDERFTRMSPNTANALFGSVVRVIFKAMAAELELERNPFEGVNNFDASQHETYTDEAPNSLTSEWAVKFLEQTRRAYPQHYAMTLLGFVTGKRPSSLRPLRRDGESSDLDAKGGFIRFRRSNSKGQALMQGEKTGARTKVFLAPEVFDVLEDHVARLKRPKQRESVYLFPSFRGGMRTRSVLDKPFRDVARKIGLPYPITPRAMRRTFQDLCREAGVSDLITRKISGHATASMQERYSTAQRAEIREATGKVIRLIVPSQVGKKVGNDG